MKNINYFILFFKKNRCVPKSKKIFLYKSMKLLMIQTSSNS